MEDILPILFIAVAIAIRIITESKKRHRKAMEEAFPTISPAPKEEQNPRTATVAQIAPEPNHSIAPATSRKRKAVRAKMQSETPVAAEPTAHSRIELRSPRKAREAFIYSEIFNRKYQ